LAFALTRHFPFREVLSYWVAQFAGAILASLLLGTLFTEVHSFGLTTPHVASMQAIIWELVMTFFLMLVIMAVATDTRAVGIMAGAAIGAVVMIDAFVGGWATGASMNPARSLGPALLSVNYDTLWIYFLGPFAGAVLGAISYKFLIRAK
jgi:glycerol uptake facilitator-like aquaporin